MRFVLFVEGHLERQALPAFLKRWLDPRLERPVGIQAVRFEGWAELVKDAPTSAGMYLSSQDVIGVIALLDLYGPTFYPTETRTADDRYAWAKKHLERQVGDPKFRQFFAVHETEAWLLSDPNLFPRDVADVLRKLPRPPEGIDFDEPPAKLLQRVYKEKTRRTYKKRTHGSELFRALDPSVACRKCPRLNDLLDEMLRMARDAGL